MIYSGDLFKLEAQDVKKQDKYNDQGGKKPKNWQGSVKTGRKGNV